MKNFPLIALLFICSILFYSCNKDITEPEHKADGSNVVYLKTDDNEEFLLDSRNKRLHKKTAGKFDDYDNAIVRFDEFLINNQEIVNFSIFIEPYHLDKAEFKNATIIIRFNKNTLELDTAFLRKYLSDAGDSFIRFETEKDEYKSFYVDSILDYKIVKWDPVNKIFSMWANCTYGRFPKPTPTNPKIYFYLDLKYEL